MDMFKQHEIFEIEVLDRMKRTKMLDPLVFGGGTMLRLCHELNRYSVDLDFWFLKRISHQDYLNTIHGIFKKYYEITDAHIKHFTLLIELRSRNYPKRLKIEIRRPTDNCDFQETIAFSRFATKQVALRAHTLDQTMNNKIKAFLNREEIRDCFDIEFLLRKGIDLPYDIGKDIRQILKKIERFKDRDFKVKLGSILEADFRTYYTTQRFSFLKERLSSALSTT